MNDLEKLRKLFNEHKERGESFPDELKRLIVYLETNNLIHLEINDFFRV